MLRVGIQTVVSYNQFSILLSFFITIYLLRLKTILMMPTHFNI